MIDAPEIVTTEAQHTAVIRVRVPRAEIQEVMGPAIHEVLDAVTAQGIGPASAVFSQHFRMQPDIFDFEVGVAVRSPVTPAGRVVAAELPACRAARTIYRGGYEGLGDGWGELMAWMKREGHAHAESLWERYLKGPETGAPPAEWETELIRPLAR
jgi:effector-binding domain-containing protein